MIRLALEENKHKKVVHNIRGIKKKYIKNQHLLTKKDLFKKVLDEKKTNTKTQYYKLEPNWDFLMKNSGSTFMLDEAHRIAYSRNFQSQENKAISSVFAEIRKLTKDSGNFNSMRTLQRVNNGVFSQLIYHEIAKHNNVYVTSQTTSKIEKDIRDLSQVHIHCHSVHLGEHMFVYNDFYFIDANDCAIEKFINQTTKPKRSFFYANTYFPMYDRFAIVDMRGEML